MDRTFCIPGNYGGTDLWKGNRKVIRKKDQKENETFDEGTDTVENIFKKNR